MRKIKIVPSLLSSFLVADCNWFTIEWKILIQCWLEATCRCSRCCFPWPRWVFRQWTCWDKFGPITSASKVFLKYFCVEQNLSQLNFADSCQMILTSFLTLSGLMIMGYTLHSTCKKVRKSVFLQGGISNRKLTLHYQLN